jgi:hypothetical protein
MILQTRLKYRYHEGGVSSQVNPDFDCCQIIPALRNSRPSALSLLPYTMKRSFTGYPKPGSLLVELR